MAGTIIADTLTHSTAGSVTTDYVVNGSAKAWARSSSTAIVESINTSSFTDNGTGDYTIGFANAFTTNTFAGTTSGLGTAARIVNYSNAQTTSLDLDTFAGSTGSYVDTATGLNVHGDLA